MCHRVSLSAVDAYFLARDPTPTHEQPGPAGLYRVLVEETEDGGRFRIWMISRATPDGPILPLRPPMGLAHVRAVAAGSILTVALSIVPFAALGQSREDPQLQELARRLSGSFSSREQSLRDSTFSDIRLRMVPIWPEKPTGFWLYVEQAEADTQDRPYRQRVYHLVSEGSETFRMDIYALPGDPLAFAGAWKRTDPLAELRPSHLLLREGCSVILRVSEGGDFTGSTDGRDCVSTLRGAAYATSEARIGTGSFENWDRGFDESGQQVWGSTSGGYVFKAVERWKLPRSPRPPRIPHPPPHSVRQLS